MTKHTVRLLVLVVCSVVIGLTQARLAQGSTLEKAMTRSKSPQSDPSDHAVQAILQRRIDQEKQSLGMVVGFVSLQGRRIISDGHMAESDPRQPDGNTIFEIGSISKVFTALLLADLVERGELSLNDPISKFLPTSVKAPHWNGKEITLVDLATHTSGLPRLPDNLNPQDIENPYADYSVQQLYEFLSRYQLTRDIGTQYEYSNLGFGLLGQLLSLKSGMNYETLVTTRIAQPLQMQRALLHE